MTNEFDPLNFGVEPGSVEAYQLADDLQKEDEKKNVEAGLNPDGTEKVLPPVAKAPVQTVAPAPAPVSIRDHKIPFVKDAPVQDLSLSPEQLLIKEKLAGEEKYSFYVPLDPGEKKGAVRPVTINGYRCEVPKGMQVQLPKSLYLLLVQAYDAEAEVLSGHENNLNNADGEVLRALKLD